MKNMKNEINRKLDERIYNKLLYHHKHQVSHEVKYYQVWPRVYDPIHDKIWRQVYSRLLIQVKERFR